MITVTVSSGSSWVSFTCLHASGREGDRLEGLFRGLYRLVTFLGGLTRVGASGRCQAGIFLDLGGAGVGGEAVASVGDAGAVSGLFNCSVGAGGVGGIGTWAGDTVW